MTIGDRAGLNGGRLVCHNRIGRGAGRVRSGQRRLAMSLQTETKSKSAADPGAEIPVVDPMDLVIELEIGPGNLDRFLELVGEEPGPRIKFLNGSLTLVSPSARHERGVDRLDPVIKAVCDELDIHYFATA